MTLPSNNVANMPVTQDRGSVSQRLGTLLVAGGLLATSCGVIGDGLADDRDALFNFIASPNNAHQMVIPAGIYNIGSTMRPVAADVSLWVSPTAIFTGASEFDLKNLIPYIPAPVTSLDLYSKTYGSDWNGIKNVFQRASFAKANIARGGGSVGPAVVALFGSGEAAAASSAVWGANIASYATADTAVAISCEIDSAAMTSGAIAYNTVLVAVGNYPTRNAIQIQANNASAWFNDGIYFNNRQAGAVNGTGDPITVDVPAVTGALIRSDTGSAARGIYFSQSIFTTAEIDCGGLVVGPTAVPSGGQFRGFIRIDSDVTGNPKIKAKDTDGTGNVNLDFYTQVAGSHQFLTGSTAVTQVKITDTAGATNYVQLSGGSSDVTISNNGSGTNGSISMTGKGTGGGKMRDGGSAIKVQWNTTGLGFFAATPVAKQTVDAAVAIDGSATSAQLASLANSIRTSLVNYGLAA